MASGPKHKPKEIKKKTLFDKLGESALFVLIIIILIIVDVVAFIFWLSAILSGDPNVQGWPNLVTVVSFQVWAGLAAVLGLFWGLAWLTAQGKQGKT